MRVTQKIVVGTISINSVQNSSIVQIGSSGMIQSQSESYGGNGNGTGIGGTNGMGTGQPGVSYPSATLPNQTAQPQAKNILKGSLQCAPQTGEIPPYIYGPTGPLGPVGGIGVTRDSNEKQDI